MRRVLVAWTLALFPIDVDFLSVQAALPEMAKDLGSSVTAPHWVLSGFMLVLASFLIVGGRFADVQGRRRWMITVPRTIDWRGGPSTLDVSTVTSTAVAVTQPGAGTRGIRAVVVAPAG